MRDRHPDIASLIRATMTALCCLDGALIRPAYAAAGQTTFRDFASGRLLLQILLPLAAGGETVHHGTMREGALGSGNILRFA
jgi:hypothetical protein